MQVPQGNPLLLSHTLQELLARDTVQVDLVPEKKGLFLKHVEYEVSSQVTRVWPGCLCAWPQGEAQEWVAGSGLPGRPCQCVQVPASGGAGRPRHPCALRHCCSGAFEQDPDRGGHTPLLVCPSCAYLSFLIDSLVGAVSGHSRIKQRLQRVPIPADPTCTASSTASTPT